MGRTIALEIEGSSNIGLYAYATDEYCLVGKTLTDEQMHAFERALEVPVHAVSIGGSNQVGVYLNGNSKILLIPDILNDAEKMVLDNLKINYAIIDTKDTALGNNLLVGEKYFFCNPGFDNMKALKEALGFEGEQLELEDWEVIGSIAYSTSKGGLIQSDVPDEAKELIEKKLGLIFEKGTLNFGSRIISGGVVANKNGMVVGKASAGIEITNADLAFGFLERS